jgi:hypothetical protein
VQPAVNTRCDILTCDSGCHSTGCHRAEYAQVKRVWRAFVMAGKETLSTSELKAFVYCLRQHRDGHVSGELCRSIRRPSR